MRAGVLRAQHWQRLFHAAAACQAYAARFPIESVEFACFSTIFFDAITTADVFISPYRLWVDCSFNMLNFLPRRGLPVSWWCRYSPTSISDRAPPGRQAGYRVTSFCWHVYVLLLVARIPFPTAVRPLYMMAVA